MIYGAKGRLRIFSRIEVRDGLKPTESLAINHQMEKSTCAPWDTIGNIGGYLCKTHCALFPACILANHMKVLLLR